MATRKLAKAMHLGHRPGLMRMFGVREMATGMGLLSQQRRAPWLWARVAGDVMDLVTLGAAFSKTRRNKSRLGAALAAVAGVTAVDVLTGRRLGRMHRKNLEYQI